jgi:hypothetical protein
VDRKDFPHRGLILDLEKVEACFAVLEDILHIITEEAAVRVLW